ncbi:MAG: tocopherol cyclase [Thermotogaceae bacterium]|nr:tocopherol cyclase [Thermotogaceae bacterium]
MNIYHPENYHGKNKKNFFEGWYFKNSDSQQKYVFAVIPGVSIGDDSHSFIQIIDNDGFSKYYRFDFDDFKSSNNPFSVSIRNNYFSLKKIVLDLEDISAELFFENIKPWPVTLFKPGAMGPYGFLNFLECYHGILSFNHTVKGTVVVRGKEKDFKKGKGYIEKDWGRSFPKSWIWSASNDFENSDASFTVSIANVPFGRSYFVGFILGLYLNGKIYQFTTYNGAKIHELYIENNKISFKASRKKYHLEVEIIKGKGNILLAPKNGNMVGRINESLDSEIRIIFRKGNEIVFSGKGINAGLEVNGDILKDIKNDKKGKVFLKE